MLTCFTCVRSKQIVGSPLMLFYDGLDICWRRPIQWPPRWADSSAVQTLLEKETCKSRLSWHSMQHSQTAVTTENSQCIMQTSFPEKEGQLNNLFFQWLDRICVVFPTWREVGDRQAEQVDAVAAGPQGSGTRGVSAPLSGLVLVALPAALTMVSPHSRQMQQGQRTKRVRWSCPFLCLWALISNAFRLR